MDINPTPRRVAVTPVQRYLFVLVIVPVACAVTVLIVYNVFLNEAVAFTCAVICLLAMVILPHASRFLLFVVAAFLLSIVGDLFMINRASELNFIVGIAVFFLAHVSFLVYAFKIIKLTWPVAAIITVPYLVFYFVALLPSPGLAGQTVLAIAALVYLLVSCVSCSVAVSGVVRTPHSPARWFFAAGIASLMVSDTFIAMGDFMKISSVSPFMMPLYYLAHVLIALSVTVDRAPEQSAPARLATTDARQEVTR